MAYRLLPDGSRVDVAPIAAPDPVETIDPADLAALSAALEVAECWEALPATSACQCRGRCRRGRSRRPRSGVTLLDCYRCPESPSKSRRSDSTERTT